MKAIGIDPGLDGGIAIYRPGLVTIMDMPTHEVYRNGKKKREVSASGLVEALSDCEKGHHAYVERVNAMPKQGVTSMFSFGMSYGVIIGVLAALRIPYTLVTPQKWRKYHDVRPGKDGSRLRASELLPDSASHFSRVKDHGRADAALIAMYGFEKELKR